MTDFQREERYIVVKLKDLTPEQDIELGNYIASEKIPTRECVVAEPHHPHYEETWENVQRWAEGRPTVGGERDELASHAALLCRRWQEFLDAGDERDGAAWVMQEAVEDSPANSLARRDALKQVEALEKVNLHGGREVIRFRIQLTINELRRQAEGGE